MGTKRIDLQASLAAASGETLIAYQPVEIPYDPHLPATVKAPPNPKDIKTIEEYAKRGVTKGRDMWIDLAWALINSPEFLLRH